MPILKETLERILQIDLEGIFTVTTPSGHGRSETRETPFGLIKYRLEPFDRVIDGILRSDEHAEYFNLMGPHGMLEATYSESLGMAEIALNHMGIATSVPGFGRKLERSLLISPQFRVFLTSLSVTKGRGPRSDLVVKNQTELDSLIHSVRSIASFQYQQPRDTDELTTYGLPEPIAEALMQAVDREIGEVSRFSRSTMTGVLGGGGVGKFRFVHDGKKYWFKIDTNEISALKSSVIPSVIYDWARRGNALAISLARMIPPPLNFFPVRKGSYYVTFSEDVSSRVISYTPVDIEILKPELDRKELDPSLLARIYTTALYHEIVTEIADDFIDEVMKLEVVPTNLQREILIDRLGSRFSELKSIFDRSIGRGYEENVERLLEHQSRGMTLGIYDNKPDNYVGSCFVDFGISKQGDEIDDLARLILGREEAIRNTDFFNNYVDAYVRIRQRIQQQYRGEVRYSPSSKIKPLVQLQLEYDTWRTLAWTQVAHLPEDKFLHLCRCAQAFSE